MVATAAARNDREAVLDELLAVAPVAVLVLDEESTVVEAAGDGFRLVGLEPRRLVGKRILHDLAPGTELATAVRTALGGDRARGTHALRALEWEFATSPRIDACGRVTGCLVLSFNVTDRGRRERAERENEAKTRFIASLSHELRTPLNSILGFNQLLADESFGPLTERQRRYVSNIERSGGQLLSLLNEILDLAKVSSGAMELDLRPVSARLVAATVLETARPLAEAGDVELSLEAAGADRVIADERRLGQALLNLVGNGIKFTPAGGRVAVRVEPGEREVRIAVSDTGVGIAPEHREEIFHEFRQLGPGRAAGGTGLGLPLALQLVVAMGGRLDLESELGSGSTFTIALPRA